MSIVEIVLIMEQKMIENPAWYIVKFQEENTVEAVPVNWFKDLSHCYWPPYKDAIVAEAIRLNEVPSKSWKVFSCKLLSKTKIVDYPTAMKKACRAQYESEISESESPTNNLWKQIRKRNTKYDDEISDEEYTVNNKRTKSITLPPTFGKIKCINILYLMLIYFLCYEVLYSQYNFLLFFNF